MREGDEERGMSVREKEIKMSERGEKGGEEAGCEHLKSSQYLISNSSKSPLLFLFSPLSYLIITATTTSEACCEGYCEPH